jgi:hypothetical protein
MKNRRNKTAPSIHRCPEGREKLGDRKRAKLMVLDATNKNGWIGSIAVLETGKKLDEIPAKGHSNP